MPKVKEYLRITAICFLIAFICLFGYIMLQNMCSEIFIRLGFESRGASHIFELNYLTAISIGAVLFPVIEELIFRLFACNVLKLIKFPDWCVIVLTAIIFAIYHGSWSQTIYQFLMGVWFAWIFLKTRQILWTMLIHFINNAFIITYTYFAGTGNDVFNLSAWNIVLSVGLAIITTVSVFFLIKKGIPNYEK